MLIQPSCRTYDATLCEYYGQDIISGLVTREQRQIQLKIDSEILRNKRNMPLYIPMGCLLACKKKYPGSMPYTLSTKYFPWQRKYSPASHKLDISAKHSTNSWFWQNMCPCFCHYICLCMCPVANSF